MALIKQKDKDYKGLVSINKRNKFNVSQDIVRSGYRSVLEKVVHEQCLRALRAGKISAADHEDQKDVVHYISKHKYLPDVVIITRTGKKIYIEAKGAFWPGDQKKYQDIKIHHPDIDIRFVFKDLKSTTTKGGKMKVGRWCDIKGFKYSEIESRIPQEWFDE